MSSPVKSFTVTSASSEVLDKTTLAAHDFDIDTRTGFLPPQEPLSRLPSDWDEWEDTLEAAVVSRLQLGSKSNLPQVQKLKSSLWRDRVRNLHILPTTDLIPSEILLRRAHQVLAWMMHFYIHSLPPDEPIRVPPSITVPLLRISKQLQLPPVLTYSDTVLYNWCLDSGDPNELPTIPTIKCRNLFTSTDDESEFYLVSARMELAGVEALDLMRSTMDEMFVGDDLSVRRITSYLSRLVVTIRRLRELLVEIKLGCDPQVFYHDVRPWLRGEDSINGQKWVFEGLEADVSLKAPVELSGPSAGQSALIHAIDIFLGVDKSTHRPETTLHGLTQPSFLQRMQIYMPRYHRSFLTHITKNPEQLRDFILTMYGLASQDGARLLEAYNEAVSALKQLRDEHMKIVTLYIIGPSRSRHSMYGNRQEDRGPLKGTGGTDLVRFLKEVRNRTEDAIITT